MKCVQKLNHVTGAIEQTIRVSDDEARKLVEQDHSRVFSWEYCPKKVWKTLVRDAEASNA